MSSGTKQANLTLNAGQTKGAAMAKTEHRFGESAIDGLNGHRSGRRVSAKDFALLMIGLVILLVLLYVQIVW
jgi:hypothetical protein